MAANHSQIYFCEGPVETSLLKRSQLSKSTWHEIRGLQKLNLKYNWKILFFVGQWVAAAWAVMTVQNPLIQIACYFLMSCSVVGLPIMMHESCHSLLYKQQTLNRWVGFVCGLPGLVSVSAYRSIHTTHHANTRTLEDPDDIEVAAGPSVSLTFAYYFVLLVGIYLYIPTVATTGYRKANARMRANIAVEYALLILTVTLVAILVPFNVLLKLWIIPLMIAGQLSSIRGIAEHGLMTGGNEFTDTRSVLSNRFVSFMMCNLNYHLEHHLFPGVPWYNLPRIHEILRVEYAKAGASVYRSYTQFLLDFFKVTWKEGITSNMRLIPAHIREEVCA